MFLVVVLSILAPKVSPFTEVGFDADKPLVHYEGKRYELKKIDGIPAAKLIAASKRAFGRKWQKRIAEDLCELFEAMGHHYGPTVSLELQPVGGGALVKVKAARMTRENRKQVRAMRRRRGRPRAEIPTLPAEVVRSDARQLAGLLRERYAYFGKQQTDGEALVAPLLKLDRPMPRAALARALQDVVNRFGDGHAGVRGARSALTPGYAPFLFGRHGKRVFAFRADRSGFVDHAFPYVRSIDGKPIATWITAADALVAQGSPQLRAQRGVRMLRWLKALGAAGPKVAIELETAGREKTRTLTMSLVDRRPAYGAWPHARRSGLLGLLKGNLGYIRVDEMRPDHRAVRELKQLWKTDGLVIDVRGNGGGTRDALRALLPYFLEAPRVCNVARYRLGPGERNDPGGHMANRYLYPLTWREWSAADRVVLTKYAKTFKPEWDPTGPGFSAWHYMLVRPGPRRYGKPVVVLLDAGCFSATDIFLGAFKGVEGVTLLGEASGGGSARSQTYRLARSGLSVRLATMASFRPNGKLYDGRGVAPDVVVPAIPADALAGGTDTQLAAALARLREPK